ncbi:hypothetical protein HHI36_010253 [Cryptolaemus montrouzieri]|uniref:Uncharacterized protein n=1 Tax=Cryptolaemus montrouzieri TaxID=559131 RepID=A0ABD2MIY4_9CUCU
MGVLIVWLSLCALIVNTQGFALKENFFQEEEHVLNEIRNIILRDDEGDIFNATVNDYGSEIIDNVNKMLTREGFDPLPVEDIKEGYWWGYLKLTKINVTGIASLFRSGDFAMSYNHLTKQLEIDFLLGFQDLGFECSYKTAVVGIGPSGEIIGEVKDLEMLISLIIDYDLDEAIVKEYKITRSGHIKIDLRGHPLIDWWNDIIINSATTLFKGLIEHTVDNMVTHVLDQVVDTIDRVLEIILGSG